MNLTTQIYAEICKQGAFISALVAGFSFAFLGALIVSAIKSKIIDWLIGLSIISISGLLVCSLAWTLTASRMAFLSSNNTSQVPEYFTGMHRSLSFVFIFSFFTFIATLGLSGWVRSRKMGIISSGISLIALVFFIAIMSHFLI
jgi:hypothetical protein